WLRSSPSLLGRLGILQRPTASYFRGDLQLSQNSRSRDRQPQLAQVKNIIAFPSPPLTSRARGPSPRVLLSYKRGKDAAIGVAHSSAALHQFGPSTIINGLMFWVGEPGSQAVSWPGRSGGTRHV